MKITPKNLECGFPKLCRTIKRAASGMCVVGGDPVSQSSGTKEVIPPWAFAPLPLPAGSASQTALSPALNSVSFVGATATARPEHSCESAGRVVLKDNCSHQGTWLRGAACVVTALHERKVILGIPIKTCRKKGRFPNNWRSRNPLL